MTGTSVYRDADYDIDKYIDKTASWPDGLHESYRFVPNLTPTVRRTSSVDDISRYQRYFVLAQSNRGKFFTWRHYLKILRDDLRHFDTIVVMSKMLLLRLATPVNSEISNYVTASEFDYSKKIPGKNKRKKRSFLRKEMVGGDVESISSMESTNSTISLTPQTNLLKKMCSEIRTLARKTCKTVEKMSTKSKYCSSCGDYIGDVKVHKKCLQPFGELNNLSKPLTPSMIKGKTVVKGQSMTFDSPLRTPSGSGEFPVLPQSSKITYAPHAVCRMKPFIKKTPKNA